MFSKLKSYKKFSNETISIRELYDIVINNPQKDLIEYIRTLEYKSDEYRNQKSFISCIMPHGIFNGLGNNNLINFSNYLYYDIDGISDIGELNDTIKNLCDKFPISFLQRSVSNKGFHFLIKINDTFLQPNDTIFFKEVYTYVKNLLISSGFNIDESAGGISRKMLISYDVNCIFNDNACLNLNNINELREIKKHQAQQKNRSITPNDTFFELIPMKELLNRIKIQTQYNNKIDGDYVIEDMQSYTILLPEKIKDGTKHKLYTRIVNSLYFINENITKQEVISYLFYVNNRALPPMDNKYLYNFINRLCKYIEETGDIKIKPRIKRIHFNKDSNLTKKQKQIMGAKLNGKLRTNKTIDIIQNAKYQLGIENKKITQSEVAKITGLSIATVKRNWKRDKEELILETPDIKKDLNNEISLEEISFNDFFSKNSDNSEIKRRKPKYYWEETELYPIAYKGKLYYEEDCDNIFVAFYHCKEALNAECGVYLAEHVWVYPDGSMGEW